MFVYEYNTVRGRRLFGVFLHNSDGKTIMKTGLLSILASCSAFDMVEAIKRHLIGSGIIIIIDIVGSTHDNAAVNKKTFDPSV